MAFYFARRSIFNQALLISKYSKSGMSFQSTAAASSLVDVKVDDKNGTAVISMQNHPVNALSCKMLQTLAKTLEDLEKNKCKGLILTSSIPNIFCAGLDIRELYKPDHEEFKTFFTALQEVWLKLYGSKMASVALINGHSPAGGCMLSLACDYRIMVKGNYTIGLNEAKLHVVCPPWLADGMAATIGFRKAELALQLGTLFNTQEAHEIGLVDQIAEDLESATKAAEAQLKELLKIPNTARHLSKMIVRQSNLKNLVDSRESDMYAFVNQVSSPPAQEEIGKYLDALKNKKR